MASVTQSMNTNAPPQAQQGNLESLLTSYDHSQEENEKMSQPLAPGSLTINVPGGSTSQQDEDFRERSLTLGSECDLGWLNGKDGRGMSFSGLLENPAVDGMTLSSEETATTAFSGSTSSTHHSANAAGPSGTAAVGGATYNYDAAAASSTTSLLPCLPENTTVPQSCSSSHTVNTTTTGKQLIPARARGDSTASQFLYGLYQQQHQHQPRTQSQMIAHTPPTQICTSYENKHFGKRLRAGSISGRLRSASDLEDTGVISREQKAILKDLIISGDNSVQGAIDKYEAGDPTALEAMIKSGALLARSSDVDLLGDLDLDFLNVHEDDDMMFGDMDDIGNTSNNPMGENNGRQHGSAQRGQTPVGDGIGDLEFNGDFSSHPSVEPKQVVGNSLQNAHGSLVHKARGNSVDDLEVYRMRANSLALPGLLLDGANPDDVTSYNFGRWMDKDIASPSQPQVMQIGSMALQRQYSPNIVAVNDSQYILDATQFSSECDVLMASKSKVRSTSSKIKKSKIKKEKSKKLPSIKKDKKEPRERKSQSKMKDMMESISGTGPAAAALAGEEEENKEVPSGLGRPRSMSDPNLSVRLDDYGLLHVNGPDGWVGAYSPDSRQIRIDRFLEKRNHRVWVKKVKYDVRKNFADSRLRVKGRFVKKEDEMLMRELMSLT
mmetsp:Transcript_10875/g.24029  ORF Transcript_10875/g.24029 Transcript_10875/m.24029 type:complete len:664 (+) Transcript_10875:262-2253(+)|eukprot:CAMPEP_0172315994 /NCGR_PEP_ID=MMETSP1058-20130122/26911_1 /TAXON_ID=83371 /ORGANISM="Detonula confervacea, Strain CCMP 353" /LENGTH=663 /DNA_ID=CAMNT_0013030211 /DNA_START=200 /DNA_END=2191 /DNA_ORIENTATION=-